MVEKVRIGNYNIIKKDFKENKVIVRNEEKDIKIFKIRKIKD